MNMPSALHVYIWSNLTSVCFLVSHQVDPEHLRPEQLQKHLLTFIMNIKLYG